MPENIRDLVKQVAEKKGKDLEGGYTKKFQALADDKKAWEDGQTERDAWKTERQKLEEDLALYKALADGEDDPRIASLTSEKDALQAELDELKAKHEGVEKEYTEFKSKADDAWLTDYKTRHEAIFSDKAKREELLSLSKYGWEEEAAAMLVGAPKELLEMAEATVRQYNLGAEGHKFAVENAKMALGQSAPAPRKPRPAAKVTAGANGAVNPTVTSNTSITNQSLKSGREAAARLALGLK